MMNAALRQIILNPPKPKIYGVSWDKGNGSDLVRTDDARGKVATAGVDLNAVRNDFDTMEIYRDIKDVTDSLGNVFVRIPKFYIRKTDTAALKTWQISKKKWGSDWYLPWCFWNFTTGGELPYVDIGKYNASSENIGGTNRLRSVAGQYPLVSQNIVAFRTRAVNNNTGGLAGYQQLDISAVDVIRTSLFIEFATIDSQSVFAGWTGGNYSATHVATVAENSVNRIIVANAFANTYTVGQPISIGSSLGGNQVAANRDITAIDVYDASNKAISFDGVAVNIALNNIVYNSGWKSGFSSGILAKSGSIGSNTTAKFPGMYRGIENPFGNVWQWTDGINTNDRQSWVCKNAANYASNVFASPYEQIGYVNANTNNYVNETGFDSNFPFAEIPASTQGSLIKYKDYYYQDAGQRVARFGASWNNGSTSGLSGWSLSGSSANARLDVGGRLVRKAI